MFNRRVILAGSAGLLFTGGLARAAQPDRDGKIAEALADLQPETEAPALAGAIIQNGVVKAAAVRGERRLGLAGPATLGDPWHLGSNAKAMTAVLYARLAEKKGPGFDAEIADLARGLAVDPAWSGATMADLLAHRAGVTDAPIGADYHRAVRQDPRPAREQRADLLAKVLAAPPPGTPGAFVYANLNYTLAAALIERGADADWQALMRREVFDPLGMKTADFGTPSAEDQPWGHIRMGDQIATARPTPTSENPQPVLRPAGGIYMSLADYARFLGVYSGAPAGFLTKASLARLTTPAAGAEYVAGWGVRPAAPWSKGPILVHEGSNVFWHVAARLDPVSGLALVGVANIGPRRPAPGDPQPAAPGAGRLIVDRLAALLA